MLKPFGVRHCRHPLRHISRARSYSYELILQDTEGVLPYIRALAYCLPEIAPNARNVAFFRMNTTYEDRS